MSAPDHERIRDLEDRSWTFALIDQVRSPESTEADLKDALRSLAYLEDYCSVAPLTAIVEDQHAADRARRGASAVVRGFDDTSTEAQRRAWWATGDPVVMEHGLGLMTRREADIVTAIAADDDHPLQAFALGCMAFGYDEAQFQEVKIRALDHPDAAVRWAAADVLLSDEPVAAEDPLLRATTDVSADVAVAAVDTLQYYPSMRVLRALSELLDAGDEQVRAKASESYEFLQGSFQGVAAEGEAAEVEALRSWMEPVRDLVRWPDAICQSESGGPPSRSPRRPMPEMELRAWLDDPDGEWKAKKDALRSVAWDSYEPLARDRLTPLLAGHPDPNVREIGGSALAAWSRSAELLALTVDPSFLVRKSAMYRLGLVPRDPSLAEPAWAYMAAEKGTTAYEALATYVAHAPAHEATARLVELARSDRREAVLTRAISLLVDLDADDEVAGLLPALDAAPMVTWAVHIELLRAIGALDLSAPPLDHLANVDNLDLMRAVVAVQVRSR